MIGPMFLYVCERLLRFIRYMQTVKYRRVRLIHDSSLPSVSSCRLRRFDFNLLSLLSDCDAAIKGAGAAVGQERFQDGGWSICLPQLPRHLTAGVAPVHHDLRPRGGLLQRSHPLGWRLDRQTHRHYAEATGGSTGTQVSPSFKKLDWCIFLKQSGNVFSTHLM